MLVKQYYISAKQQITSTVWDKPEPADNEIEVKSILTGVCSSDIAMYNGKFMLPETMHGHEGLGRVTKVGSNIEDVSVGDIVATRGEPAFAEYYNCKEKTYVKVPEVNPRYILEPVACGVNLVNDIFIEDDQKMLVIGSGFLSIVVYQTLLPELRTSGITIHVLGSSNTDFWNSATNAKLISKEELELYDIVIDISDTFEYSKNIFNKDAVCVMAVEKTFNNSVFNWNHVKILPGTPHHSGFYEVMKNTLEMIESTILDVDNLWTHMYNDVTKAFSESNTRESGKIRSYVKWL